MELWSYGLWGYGVMGFTNSPILYMGEIEWTKNKLLG